MLLLMMNYQPPMTALPIAAAQNQRGIVIIMHSTASISSPASSGTLFIAAAHQS